MLSLSSRRRVNAGSVDTSSMTINYFSKLQRETIQQLYTTYKDDFAIGGYGYPQSYIDVGIHVPDSLNYGRRRNRAQI